MLSKTNITSDKQKNYINIIINSSDQLLSIVNDILTISAIETKQEKINSQKMCVNNILDELLEVFRLHPLYVEVKISARKPLSDSEVEILSDKTKITQILTNLLTNAQKFTHRGHIEFGYTRKSESFEFYVKDTGIGIEPEMKDIIFDRFRQANIAIGKEYGGTGLGLAISKGFVDLLGGTIWVESEPGEGSTFYFTIPVSGNTSY
jgi:signal transduction histidine kinase